MKLGPSAPPPPPPKYCKGGQDRTAVASGFGLWDGSRDGGGRPKLLAIVCLRGISFLSSSFNSLPHFVFFAATGSSPFFMPPHLCSG